MTLSAGQPVLAPDITWTSGTWTPSATWTLPGNWSGTYQKQGLLVVAQASITISSVAAAWPASDMFTMSGLPFPVAQAIGGSCLVNWGNRANPVYPVASVIYVNLVNKTGSLPPAGSTILVAASYLTSP